MTLVATREDLLTTGALLELGVDYSFARPSPPTLWQDGYRFAARYLWPNTKGITAVERDLLWAAGFALLLVYESSGTSVIGGQASGAQEGTAANLIADALGYPTSYPIFYATDFAEPAADYPLNTDYLRAAQLNARPAGVYGDVALVDAMVGSGVCAYGWQTSAWSGTAVSAHANVYQRQSPTLPVVAGGGYDENVLLVPMPLWRPTAPPLPPAPPVPPPPAPKPPAPAPAPVPVPPAHRNVFTPLRTDGSFGPLTCKAQQFVDFAGNLAACDGVFGLQSKRAMQTHLGVNPDGVIGPVTVEALQRHVAAPVDGAWGPVTTQHLQSALNAGAY